LLHISRKNNNRTISGISVNNPLLLFIFSVIIFGCSEDKLQPPVLQTLNEAEMPTQESRSDKILFSDNGKLKAILYANHMKMYDRKRETLLDTMRIEFFNDKQQRTTVLTAMRGRFDGQTNNMYAMDSVVVKNDSGTVLKSEELMWRNRDRKIVTEKFVTIVSPKEKIQGYGLVADQNLDNYVIYKPAIVTASDNMAGGTK